MISCAFPPLYHCGSFDAPGSRAHTTRACKAAPWPFIFYNAERLAVHAKNSPGAALQSRSPAGSVDEMEPLGQRWPRGKFFDMEKGFEE
jgi:hypothetical protein